MSNPDVIEALAEAQIQAQGCSSFRVADGQVFVFTRPLLEKLLTKAIESGQDRCVVFVKAGAEG